MPELSINSGIEFRNAQAEMQQFRQRLAVMAGFVLLLFGVLLLRFVYLQSVMHSHYDTLAEANRISIVPVAPNRGYSRMQQLWLTERICDIVASELGLDPVEVRKRNYVRSDEMPYETPNGCVYDSGDYARCLDIALELVDYDAVRERQADDNGKLIGIGIGSTLDSGTNNFGQSQLINPDLQFSGNNEVATVKLDIFGEIVVTLGTTPQGQSHETTAAQVVADILGCDVDIVHVRAGHDSYWNSHAGFSGTYASQFAVTGLGAVNEDGAPALVAAVAKRVGFLRLQGDSQLLMTVPE